MPVPVYVISLERDADRLRAVVDQLRPYRFLELIHVKGFAGRDLPDPVCHVLTGNVWSHHHKGTLGCFMSHLNAWQMVAESDAPFSMVVEDSAIFSNCDLLETLQLPPGSHLVFCNRRTAYPVQDAGQAAAGVLFRSVDPVPAHIETHGMAVGSDGYLITPAGARKLLEYVKVDRLFSHVDLRMLAYCLDQNTIPAPDTLRKTGRNVLNFRRSFNASHRLAGYTMLPSLTGRARISSTRVIEDEAGKQTIVTRPIILSDAEQADGERHCDTDAQSAGPAVPPPAGSPFGQFMRGILGRISASGRAGR
jgi:GR25 family glycosyltransferase involved in LPS biosynthesis